MPKDRSKKVEDKQRGKDKEEEEGEGTPLKQMNEYRRSNRMEPLTKEQHDKRKAVIRGNNLEAQEAVIRMRKQTNSDKTECSNTQNSSDEQLSPGANSVSVEEA